MQALAYHGLPRPFPLLQAHMAGSSGLSLLQGLQGPPDHHLVMVVAQGYMPPGQSCWRIDGGVCCAKNGAHPLKS